ncbi:hypothetical protein [Pseudomonas aeruginosa]|uniref:hypothetical protein n=1 Tax=Pseudomonas aeruginosa TaxID=287 RepID=UPI0020775127|nr:hypothetical protein [Pseudomonas aeruginosa]MCM8614340.1 hypothetical protein [Pseudomonas aeruginosa]MCM8718517.1 hypothetical protein [Pseudomonas aeruginosa]MCP2672119.1 hypothetical protein [Pseudomonas aeruginosa]
MFWSKNRIVQVEVVNPRITLEVAPSLIPPAVSEAPQTLAPDAAKPSLDVALKLAAVVAAVVNACLIIFGYMRYLAMLELFGIERSEISFSVADLLAFGYGSTLNMAFSTRVTQIVFGGTSGLVALGVVLLLWRHAPSWKQILVAWLLGCLIAFLPTVPIVVSYLPAKRSQLAIAAGHLGVEADKLDGLAKRSEVLTIDGWKEGDILLATNEFTFLLADSIVWKVRQADGVIVRRTHLSAKLKEVSKADD